MQYAWQQIHVMSLAANTFAISSINYNCHDKVRKPFYIFFQGQTTLQMGLSHTVRSVQESVNKVRNLSFCKMDVKSLTVAYDLTKWNRHCNGLRHNLFMPGLFSYFGYFHIIMPQEQSTGGAGARPIAPMPFE